MDEKERKLLESTFNFAKENNEMLHKIRRSQKIANFVRFMYWILVIGITIGAFYFLQPYIVQMQDFIQKTGVDVNTFKNILPKQISG